MTPNRLTLAASLPIHWRGTLLSLLFCLTWVVLLYREAVSAMVLVWYRSATFTHGFLVLPIVLWLVWRQRKAMGDLVPKPAPGALLPIALVGLVWLMAELVSINALMQLALVALLVLCVVSILGRAVAGTMVFPLAFLFFAVPVGEFLLPQFMEWTANFTVAALRLSGIPVYREGLDFAIPTGRWSVVEACSGVRYLIASLTVGTLFAYLNYRSTMRRLLFVAVSVVVPIVANWMRAYLIVMLGHLSGNQIAAGVDHLIYGWVFFGIVMLLMFMVGARWAEPGGLAAKPAAQAPSSTLPAPAPAPAHPTIAYRLWATTVGLALLVAAPHIALWALNRGADNANAVQLDPPLVRESPWQTIPEGSLGFRPAYQNPSAQAHSAYLGHGQVVELYVGFYRHQGDGHELVSSNNVLVTRTDSRWAQRSGADRSVTAGSQNIPLKVSELHPTGLMDQFNQKGLLVWRFYWVHGRTTRSDYLAKVYAAIYRILGRGDDSAVIVLSTPKGENGQGEAALKTFLLDNYESINERLAGVRQHQ